MVTLRPKKKAAVVARHDSEDESGNIKIKIERHEPKSFRIKKQSDGNGGWIYRQERYHHYSLSSTRYHKICKEGYRRRRSKEDTDNLTKMGFTATTNPFGAGNSPEHFGQYFDGTDVVLIPDNDDPGRGTWARLPKIFHGHAASIKLLEDSQNLPAGDVSDFISKIFQNKAEAAERLADMINGAPLYEPERHNRL